MKIGHFGCGTTILPYADNYDKYPCDDCVQYLDMDQLPYPIKSDTYDKTICRHVLEHLNSHPYDVMMELHRITKPGGEVVVELPIFGNLVSHRRHLHSRNYMNPICRRKTMKDMSYIRNSFHLVRQKKCNRRPLLKVLWKIKTRMVTWIDSFWYDGYEWILEVRK